LDGTEFAGINITSSLARRPALERFLAGFQIVLAQSKTSVKEGLVVVGGVELLDECQ